MRLKGRGWAGTLPGRDPTAYQTTCSSNVIPPPPARFNLSNIFCLHTQTFKTPAFTSAESQNLQDLFPNGHGAVNAVLRTTCRKRAKQADS
ncbi:hypothetical protein BaRGS_00038793 [Batillaria attramentaria]|uniref:Uncharacterized protein n=1 Tax=Batillaria attramentaria TaxID=370345 RepID=A0ABD0J4Q8_9CAEN